MIKDNWAILFLNVVLGPYVRGYEYVRKLS